MAKKEEKKRWKIEEIESQQESNHFLSDEEMEFVRTNNKKHFLGDSVEELQIYIKEIIKNEKQTTEFLKEIKPVIQSLLDLQSKYKIEFKDFKKHVSNLLDAKVTKEQKELLKQIQKLESQKFMQRKKK